MPTDIPYPEVRAGVISSLMLAIGYLHVTGLFSQFRVWAFVVLMAVCFVLMLKSLVDLLAWAFGVVMVFSGRSLGRVFRLIRSL